MRNDFILIKECHCDADEVRAFCQEHNLNLRLVVETSQIESVQSFVMAGLGISLVPQMARVGGKRPLVYRSLESPMLTRSVTVVWRKGRENTPAGTGFLNHLRQTAKAFIDTLKK